MTGMPQIGALVGLRGSFGETSGVYAGRLKGTHAHCLCNPVGKPQRRFEPGEIKEWSYVENW